MIKLNLIPAYKKREIGRANRLHQIFKWEIVISFLILMLFVILLSVYSIVRMNLQAATLESSSSDSGKYAQLKQYDEKLKEANSEVGVVDKIQRGQFYWSGIFNKINALILPGIKLSGINTQNLDVYLTGNADTRDHLMAFKEKLAGESCFQNVNLPISDLVSQVNVDFQIQFTIKDSCLKNQ